MVRDAGLPRSWFKHQIYAPGFYTGAGKDPPAIAKPSARNWSRLSSRCLVSETINQIARRLIGRRRN
jgi:hypothetical protein